MDSIDVGTELVLPGFLGSQRQYKNCFWLFILKKQKIFFCLKFIIAANKKETDIKNNNEFEIVTGFYLLNNTENSIKRKFVILRTHKKSSAQRQMKTWRCADAV